MRKDHLEQHAAGLLVGFAIQFLAGMTLNLFVTLPASHPGANGSDYFASSAHGLWWALSNGGGAVLTAHVYLALALSLGCLGLLVQSLMLRRKVWAWSSGITLLFTIGALFNGLSFVDYNHDFSSMIMASCWIIAVSALVVGLISSSKSHSQHS